MAVGCGKTAPDYSQWYAPEEESPSDPDDPGVEGTGETICVMSSNVRYGSASSDLGTSNSWDNRKAAYPAMMEDLKPLVMGVQEAEVQNIVYVFEI